jgi:hypothetical protein
VIQPRSDGHGANTYQEDDRLCGFLVNRVRAKPRVRHLGGVGEKQHESCEDECGCQGEDPARKQRAFYSTPFDG